MICNCLFLNHLRFCMLWKIHTHTQTQNQTHDEKYPNISHLAHFIFIYFLVLVFNVATVWVMVVWMLSLRLYISMCMRWRETFLILLCEWVTFRRQLNGNKQSQHFPQYGFRIVCICVVLCFVLFCSVVCVSVYICTTSDNFSYSFAQNIKSSLESNALQIRLLFCWNVFENKIYFQHYFGQISRDSSWMRVQKIEWEWMSE